MFFKISDLEKEVMKMQIKSITMAITIVFGLFLEVIVTAASPDVEIVFPETPTTNTPVIINDSGYWNGLIQANEVGFSDFQRRNSKWEQIGANINSEMIFSKDDDYEPVITNSGINHVICKYYVGWFGFADLLLDEVSFLTSPWIIDKQILNDPPRVLLDVDLVGRRLTVAEWGTSSAMQITPLKRPLGNASNSQDYAFIGNAASATGLIITAIDAANYFSNATLLSGTPYGIIASALVNLVGISVSNLCKAKLEPTVDFGSFFYKDDPGGVRPTGTDLWEARGKYEIEEQSALITMYVDLERDGFVPDGKTISIRVPFLTKGCKKSFYVNIIHERSGEQ